MCYGATSRLYGGRREEEQVKRDAVQTGMDIGRMATGLKPKPEAQREAKAREEKESPALVKRPSG